MRDPQETEKDGTGVGMVGQVREVSTHGEASRKSQTGSKSGTCPPRAQIYYHGGFAKGCAPGGGSSRL